MSDIRTYSTRVEPASEISKALDGYARAFSKAVRTDFARSERGLRSGNELSAKDRKDFLMEHFRFTSRQANSVMSETDAKRSAIQELQKLYLADLKERLKKQKAIVSRESAKLGKHKNGKVFRMNKEGVEKAELLKFIATTKVAKLNAKIKALESDIKGKVTRLTFGTKKLLKQRTTQVENDKDLRAWRREWDVSRNGQFLVVGSKDESAGCQGCQATENADGSFNLSVDRKSVV